MEEDEIQISKEIEKAKAEERKKKILLVSGIVVLVLFATIYFSPKGVFPKNLAAGDQSKNLSCAKVEKHNVEGDSMEPLISSGTEVYLLKNYYDCNPLQRGDIVVFKFKTRDELFIKKLVGLPGDKVEFEGKKLKLNNKILANTKNNPYIFSDTSKKLLTTPLRNGKIPKNMYLVLGESVKDSFDSREFGYLEKEHFIGRAVLNLNLS